jgi:hypothetical protein
MIQKLKNQTLKKICRYIVDAFLKYCRCSVGSRISKNLLINLNFESNNFSP